MTPSPKVAKLLADTPVYIHGKLIKPSKSNNGMQTTYNIVTMTIVRKTMI
jgi:hypothetical protein